MKMIIEIDWDSGDKFKLSQIVVALRKYFYENEFSVRELPVQPEYEQMKKSCENCGMPRQDCGRDATSRKNSERIPLWCKNWQPIPVLPEQGQYGITKLGTQIRLPDGREATVVYNSLVGVGIKFGLFDPLPEAFNGTDGNTVQDGKPEGFEWEPDALLRKPEMSERLGMPCVCEDSEVEILRIGLKGVL